MEASRIVSVKDAWNLAWKRKLRKEGMVKGLVNLCDWMGELDARTLVAIWNGKGGSCQSTS